VEEILLGAFFYVWTDRGLSSLRIDVEGHGRDAVRRLDASRTVGWFTAATPLLLEVEVPSAEDAVRAVGTALARLPGGRSTYGLLRYLHPDPAVRDAMKRLPDSRLLFNDLSTVEEVIPAGSPFQRAQEPTGRARSSEAPRAYRVEINAMVRRGRLTVNLEYARGDHGAEEMESVLDELRSVLLELATGPSAGSSDLELAGLDEAGLSRVAELLAEIDGA
jgi:non-ribosomal peptide synthase protein (TIGR01720 family)